MEAYRSGHNEPHSKCGCPQGHVGSNPTASAKKPCDCISHRVLHILTFAENALFLTGRTRGFLGRTSAIFFTHSICFRSCCLQAVFPFLHHL